MPSLVVNSSTDGQQLVAAPGARRFIRVIGLDLTAGSAVAPVSLKSNNTTVIWETQAMGGSSAGGIVLNVDRERTIDCNPNESLNLGLNTSVTVQGTIEYIILGPPPS
jgi:hypothetical protein